MSLVQEDKSVASPSTFVFTPKNLRKLAEIVGRDSTVADEISRLLMRATDELFLPYLIQARTETLEFEFERYAYAFFPFRIEAAALLIRAVGAINFFPKYLKLMSLASQTFVEAAPSWGLEQATVQEAFKKYFATSVRMLLVASKIPMPAAEPLSLMLKGITKADFGLTCLAYIFEGTLSAEKWKVKRTFELTTDALTDYEEGVSLLLGANEQVETVAGSLKIEGELDPDELQRDLPLDWLHRRK
jgi:hypothetical protein